jgi:Uma2 family endonuclease
MGATATAIRKRHTYADYEKLPEGSSYQLIGGELVMTPAPTPYHQRISRKIEYALLQFVEANGLGEIFYAPIDIYLSNEETYQPDIIFISKERLSIIGEKKIEGAPDLVVEILSPATAYYDLRHKMRVYEKSGVKEYWIVDPDEKTVELYESVGGEFSIFSKAREKGGVRSKLLPGLELDPAKIF